MPNPLNVFLIEDSPLLRAQLIETLEDLHGIRVVGHAEDEASALIGLRESRPDLAIVDLELKAGSGLGVLRALQGDPAGFNHAAAVVLTTHSHPAVKATCTRLGASAFFDKAMQMDELLAYVESARGA